MTASPASRHRQIRLFLQQNNLHAWLAWRPDELLMLSQYFPAWGASLLIYFADAEPVLFVPLLEPREHIPAGLRVQEYPWGDLKCADPYSVLVSAVGAELAKAKVSAEKVGMNLSSARTSLPINAAEQIPIPEDFAKNFSSVSTRANGEDREEVRAGFANLYLRKTAPEIQAIGLANQVANIGLRAFFENLHPGISEAELAASVECAIHRQIGHSGIFHSRGWAMVQSGPNSAEGGRFNRSTGRRLQNGDLVLIELGTCVNGYWSDVTRTEAVGTPNDQTAEILSLARDAQHAALDGVRPGIAAGEIDALARDKISAKGFASFFTHHTGHHVGFRYHDPGFMISPGESAKLEPGMVLTIEPGVYIPERGCGARVEDNVLVTDSGHQVLSRIPGTA
ncbi:MAG: Xaa-Pro peptidase family protein [Candidatus Acidiferrales bacterium]